MAIRVFFLAIAVSVDVARTRPFFSLLKRSAILAAALVAVGFTPTVLAQPDRRVEQRIHEVENTLMPAVVLKGQRIPHMNILDRMHHYGVPGVSVAVINDYAIDWAKGYGFMDKESNRPVDVKTLFQAGSISKPVTAVAAMYLVEHGLLTLDRDVNQKLKSWKVPENRFTEQHKVTVRGLLSHSAGLTVHGFPGYSASEAVPRLTQILDGEKPANTYPIRVDYVPGTRVRYSGGGYTVLQLLLTDIVGTPFPQLMQDLVLSKIEMLESTYEQPLPARCQNLSATGYRANGDPVPGGSYTYPEMAAAGLWTSPSELARFAIEIQKSFENKSNRVLSQASVTQMLTKQENSNRDWPAGLGFFLEGKGLATRFGHLGGDEGFQAMLLCTLHSGKGVVIMTNSNNGIDLALEIAYSVAARYGWPDYGPEERSLGGQLSTVVIVVSGMGLLAFVYLRIRSQT